MPIKPQTLIIAIQCVAVQTGLLDKTMSEETTPHSTELEQLRASMDLAASDLKAAYEAATEHHDGLPPYERLISPAGSVSDA